MEKARKLLKIDSYCILVLVIWATIKTVLELCFFKVDAATLPEGTTEELLWISKILFAVVSFVLILPQLYLVFKGLKVAKKPDSSKGHIRWATVLLVLAAIGCISPILAIVRQQDILNNLLSAIVLIADVVIYFDYLRNAKAVAAGE